MAPEPPGPPPAPRASPSIAAPPDPADHGSLRESADEDRALLLEAIRRQNPRTLAGVGLAPREGGGARTLRLPTSSEVAPMERAPEQAAEGIQEVEPEPAGPADVGPHLAARAELLARSGDTVGAARAHLELAVLAEATGVPTPGGPALAHARAALACEPDLVAAHAMVRRALGAGAMDPARRRAVAGEMLPHLDVEIRAAQTDAARADLRAERARLLAAQGAAPAKVRAAWEEALAASPNHPASLRGLEAILPDDDSRVEHLARMAAAYSPDDPALAAWLHVERARLLSSGGREDDVRAALDRALALAPGLGPIRDECTTHACRRRDAEALVELLVSEADLRRREDPARAARLALEAATILRLRMNDDERALALLRRAAADAGDQPSVARRALEDRIALCEARGLKAELLEAKKRRVEILSDPAAELEELRAIATLAASMSQVDEAILALERARVLEPGDATLLEELDRLLEAGGRDEARVVLWQREAAAAEAPEERARCLLRAARLSERLGRAEEALGILRAALAIAPDATEAVDAFARLSATGPAEARRDEVRARIAVYARAADRTPDRGRRVLYLEKIALLYDEALGEPELAAQAYAAVTAIEPSRRSAIVGQAAAAARAGDTARLSAALLLEADACADARERQDTTLRAAEAIAPRDGERALALVRRVLAEHPGHAEARTLEIRLHATAQQWELAAAAMEARLAHMPQGAPAETRAFALVALADAQALHLGNAPAALATLERARAIDPRHPAVMRALHARLEASGDRALAEGLAALGEARGPDPAAAARHLLRAAELFEHRLGDDERAAALYLAAMDSAPDDPMPRERAARIACRVAAAARAVTPTALERAEALAKTDARAAMDACDAITLDDRGNVAALRVLERVARAQGAIPRLANALAAQAECFATPTARLGALFGLAALVEWQLPPSPGIEPYDRILALSPGDRAALDATLRRALEAARAGAPEARAVALSALRALLGHAANETSRLGIHLGSALLEVDGAEALAHYLAALRIDPASITAAVGAAVISAERRDAVGAVAAATALADLTRAPRARARYLHEAAALLLGSDDPRLGAAGERRGRALGLLEQALLADPDAVPIAATLATVCAEERRTDRLVAALRTAMKRATAPESVIVLGTEVARIAREELHDATFAIEAMQRVREVAPTHTPSLLALAELAISQRAWPIAAEALEAASASATEPAQRAAAALSLANVLERALGRADGARQAFQVAAEAEPKSVRAHRGLLRLARAAGDRAAVEGALARLGELEDTEAARRTAWLELADLRAQAGDREGAEQALIEAAARAPGPETLAKLTAFHRRGGSQDHAALAHALEQVVARGHVLGAAEATLLATLGQLEVTTLARLEAGLGHLKRAVELAPAFHEGRGHLATALARVGAHGEAAGHLLAMLTPDSRPLLSLRDPAAALEQLETNLVADRRLEEATIVRELRAVGGALDDAARSRLGARRLAYDPSAVDPLDRATLVATLMPAGPAHALLDVGLALAGADAKILGVNLADLGISPRHRVPARSGHPLRALFDWATRVLGGREAELVISDAVVLPRILPQDVPWIVVPTALVHQPEGIQLAALARMVTRAALGVPWIEELPPLHVGAVLLAAARLASPGFGATRDDPGGELEGTVADYAPRVAAAVGRKHKKALAELAPILERSAITRREIEQLPASVARAEAKAALLVTGDLSSVLEDLFAQDPSLAQAAKRRDPSALAAILEHPIAGEVARFALGKETTRLRWRTGAIWGGA